MRAHVIENGIVVNTIEVDSLDILPNLIEATEGGIGWSYDGHKFTAPPPPPTVVPESVTMRQARLALLGAGKLSAVDAAIASLPSPMKEAAQIEWEYAIEVRRDSNLVKQLASSLGLDDAALDDLFRQATAL